MSTYRIGEFAKKVGRSTSTIRRWEREGRITSKRSAGGQRYFDDSDVRHALRIDVPDKPRATVVYCRVSSAGQKDDLNSQIAAMGTFCLGAGIAVDEWVSEVGGGMNFNRKKFLAVLDRISDGEVSHLVVAHKDRLTRFGFDMIAHIAERNDCTLTVANAESLSPQTELVNDLLAIVHTFSCRLYGLRRYEKALKADATLSGGAS